MARVAHIPYLEKRPSGYFFRRRYPTRLREISNVAHGSAICLSIRTDILSEAKTLTRSLTALSDMAFALMSERPVNHLSAQDLTLLTELARCQIAAHEAARAIADPRSEEAANFAATSERAAQEVLKRSMALGDPSLSIDPLRAVAARLGVTLNETTTEWRAVAFEALRVLLDVAQERERREVGQYDAPTLVFRSFMAERSDTLDQSLPRGMAQTVAPITAVVPVCAAVPSASHCIPPSVPPATETPTSSTHVIDHREADLATVRRHIKGDMRAA